MKKVKGLRKWGGAKVTGEKKRNVPGGWAMRRMQNFGRNLKVMTVKLAGRGGHRNFRRSYREDYVREVELPGLLALAFEVFAKILKNWRFFGKLLLFAVVMNILLVGLMSEELYLKFQDALDQTELEVAGAPIGNFARAGLLLASTLATGGLNQAPTEAQQIFGVLIFLIVWLVGIYGLRQILAGREILLRDALYNGLAPLISTMAVFVVMFLQAVPILLVVIAYSAAVSTDFLALPFYALVFFVFAVSFIILSLYGLSGSFLALVATTNMGIYPGTALAATGDLIMGRRMKMIMRLVFLVFILGVVWFVVGMPVVLLDMWAKKAVDFLDGIPIVSVLTLILTCFSAIYTAAYFYLLYRKLIEYDENR